MYEAVDHLAHLREAHQLTDLGGGQVIEALPGEVLLLDLFDNVLWDALELTKRRLREPHAAVDHLAEAQHTLCERGPSAFEHNLVEASHQPRGRLRDIETVGS